MHTIRVAIFDDQRNILDALSMLIGGTPGFEVAGTYSDASHLAQRLVSCRPDVVLMDIEMPGTDGIAATRSVRAQFPAVQIIMLTVFEDESRIFEALCAGANGYLVKSTPPARLLEAIREAAQGGAPMSPHIARKALDLFRHFAPSAPGPDYQLTPREKEVLGLLVEGLPYKLIADRLGVGYETVRSHMKHIYEKLHVASTTEAVSKALRERLI
ncbi:MAG: response regulator transcription factor [Bacteroidia bacterium]